MRAVLLLLVLLATQIAQADLKISLVTISPGAELFEAFGHTALYVEDTEKPGMAHYYAYGQVNTANIVMSPRPLVSFQKLFNNQVNTRIESEPTALDEKLGVPTSILNRYYYVSPRTKEPRKTQRVATINELKLTQEQAKKLVELVKADIAAGPYFYHNFNNNCATRVRDVLFNDAVLGQQPREIFMNDKVEKSLNQLGMESMDEAVAASPSQSMLLIPASKKDNPRIQQSMAMMGMNKLEYTSAKEFYDSVVEMEQVLESYRGSALLSMVGLNDQKLEALLASFHAYFFSPDYTTAPITRYQSFFLPKNLRAALDEMHVLGGREMQVSAGEQGPVVKVSGEAPAAEAAPTLQAEPVVTEPVVQPAPVVHEQ